MGANYFDDYLRDMEIKITKMLRVDDVKETIRAIYYGSDEKNKQKYKELLFLATDENATQWVERALKQWDEIPMFIAFQQDVNMPDLQKCLFVKIYRRLTNQKKKNKEDGHVTAEEIVAEFSKLVNC